MANKIGLLTFHDTTNFGSLLQTYGLYYKIEELGYDCEVIDYQCDSIVKRELPSKYSCRTSLVDLYRYFRYGTIKKKKYKELSRFLSDNMKLSYKCDRSSIQSVASAYSKIIVGSDIVWGLDITGGDTTYFLDFCKNHSKKFAFSSSVGSPWSATDKTIIKPLLEDFKYIAVRENESADWVEELIGKRPDVVCDPTMLLSPNIWINHTYESKECEEYVLVYFDDKDGNCLKSAMRYAAKHGLRVKCINYGKPIAKVDNEKPISLEDFLTLIRFAAFIVTASYHGMLFSIYFNRQFAYYNRAHKSRMNTLAQKLQVNHRDGSEYDVLEMESINYYKVIASIEEFRASSTNHLMKLLSNA